MKAPNPEFEAVVRESFGRQTFMATLGARIERVAPGEVDISVPFNPGYAQQNGFLHAGVITSIADSACGYSALSMAPPGHDVLSVEFKMNLLRPAAAPSFLACARVVRAGKTLTVAFAEVFGVTDLGRELVATMMSTVIGRLVRGQSSHAPEVPRSHGIRAQRAALDRLLPQARLRGGEHAHARGRPRAGARARARP